MGRMSTEKLEASPEVQDLEKQNQTTDVPQHSVPQDVEKQGSTSGSEEHQEAPAKPPANPWGDPSSFPDGGAQAWKTVAAAAACFFVSWGWINCIGVFQDYFMRVPLRNYSPSTVAWIPSVETFFMLFMGPFGGWIFDNYGPRVVLLIGSFMHVFGLMMASISHEYYQFMLAQGVCSAIGASLIFTPAIACISTWFYQKRGMAIGLSACGSSLGGVIFPIVVSRMIPEVGFGWTMRTCAFIVLALMIFANIFISSRFPPSKKPFRPMDFIRPLKEVPMILVIASAFFFYWGMFPVFSFITAHANSNGMSLSLAQYLVSILNAASVFGRTLPGILGDKVGRLNIMFIFCLFTSILILALWIPTTTNIGEIWFAVLFGFGSGAAIGLNPAIIAQISPPREIGTRTGIVIAFGSIGALTGSPIGGALIGDDHGKYLYLQLFSGVTCFVGSILYLITRLKVGGFSLKTKI